MTAPTWAEARKAEDEARTMLLNVLEDWAAAEALGKPTTELDNAFDEAEKAWEAARRVSDLALVRETIEHLAGHSITKMASGYVVNRMHGQSVGPRPLDPAAVLAALEQEGGGNG